MYLTVNIDDYHINIYYKFKNRFLLLSEGCGLNCSQTAENDKDLINSKTFLITSLYNEPVLYIIN